jgi:hypothetical protein
MKRTIASRRATAVLTAIILCTLSSAVYSMYSVWNEGNWPKTWPVELESLRKQSRSYEGPMTAHRHYAIPFTKREEMESAWPHILKVKTKGAPVVLVRRPNFFLGEHTKAGVVVHSPPLGQAGNLATPEVPIKSVQGKTRWINTTYIELLVDGDVVDLNRIALPADTPIIDERFKAVPLK